MIDRLDAKSNRKNHLTHKLSKIKESRIKSLEKRAAKSKNNAIETVVKEV